MKKIKLLTEDDNLDFLRGNTNIVLHLQGVVPSVINGSVTYGEFGKPASAADFDTLCDFYLVITEVPRADWRWPADNGQVQLEGLSGTDVDSLLRNAG